MNAEMFHVFQTISKNNMKKIIFLFLTVAIMSSCNHHHTDDKLIGNVHTLYMKEMAVMRKKVIDSMLAAKPVPISTGSAVLSKCGWFSASEMKLPPGTAVQFNPEGPQDLTGGKGPYYIIVRGWDGKQTINKVSYEKWLLITQGDILK